MRSQWNLSQNPRNGTDCSDKTHVTGICFPSSDRWIASIAWCSTEEEKIGFADGRLHSFRHYFCSACAHQGIPEQIVMSWLGHADSRVIRHDDHRNDEEAKRQRNRLHLVDTPGDEHLVAG